VNKGEREELRRLLRSRFKVLKADVQARKAELEVELGRQLDAEFAASDKAYDDAEYRIKLAADEANRVANDIGRELWGRDEWGEKYDKPIIACAKIDKPGRRERWERTNKGRVEIERRVMAALLQLDRQENELLTELATSALESAEAKQFFNRIPSVTELVPAYRLRELTE
jgi:hypothetical protein